MGACPSAPALENVLFMSGLGDANVMIVQSERDSSRRVQVIDAECKVNIIESYFDGPVALMPLTDLGDSFATLWTSGSAYVYRIFSVNAKKNPLLEIYAKEQPPTVLWDEATLEFPAVIASVDPNPAESTLYLYDAGSERYRAASPEEKIKFLKEFVTSVTVDPHRESTARSGTPSCRTPAHRRRALTRRR